MKASELVKELQCLIETHGDQEINFAAECEGMESNDGECEITSVATFKGSSGKIERFLICDYETTLSFMD